MGGSDGGLGNRPTVVALGLVFAAIGALAGVFALFASHPTPPAPPSATAQATAQATPGSTAVAGAPEVSQAGSPLPKTAPTAPVTTAYLDELPYTPDSDPYDTRDTANINGNAYPRSQGARFCFGSNRRNWEYNLGRKYQTFRATLGLDDNSERAAIVRFEVFADGRSIYKQDAHLGQAFPVNAPVNGALRLQLVSTLLSEEGGCGGATAEWGDARVEE